MNTILLGPNDVQKLSGISGNVEMDKLTPYMWIAQCNEVRRVLTYNLYLKILADFENDALTGIYLTIYNDYVLYLMVHYSASHYLTTAAYYQGNGGVFKMSPDGTTPVSKNEIDSLVAYHRNLGATYELRFKTFIKENITNIPEYDQSKINTNALKLNWIL